jgi:apolipoprotein N-acyltransferase
MFAPVSNARAQHDGFAVVLVLALVLGAFVAGFWWAALPVGDPPRDTVTAR